MTEGAWSLSDHDWPFYHASSLLRYNAFTRRYYASITSLLRFDHGWLR